MNILPFLLQKENQLKLLISIICRQGPNRLLEWFKGFEIY